MGEGLTYIKERYDTCSACEFFDKQFKFCNNCGCFLLIKVTIPMASCPLGKWDKQEVQE